MKDAKPKPPDAPRAVKKWVVFDAEQVRLLRAEGFENKPTAFVRKLFNFYTTAQMLSGGKK